MFFLWVMVLEIRFEQKKVIQIKTYNGEMGFIYHKCHLKSKFQNYGRMVVDSLKRPSRRVEKENI